MRLDYIDNTNCLEGLKEIPDKSVDLIVTDPPYGIDFQSNKRKASERLKKIANDKAPFIWWMPEAARVLKDDGCLITFFRWDVQDAFLRSLKIAGLPANGVCVWDKGGFGMGDLKKQFAATHELFSFSPMPGFAFPGKRPASVIHASKVSNAQLRHPNQKPVELIEQLIEATSNPGAIVLDMFMGSGTTAVACLKTGRHYIGFELDEKYHAIAMQRIADTIDEMMEEKL